MQSFFWFSINLKLHSSWKVSCHFLNFSQKLIFPSYTQIHWSFPDFCLVWNLLDFTLTAGWISSLHWRWPGPVMWGTVNYSGLKCLACHLATLERHIWESIPRHRTDPYVVAEPHMSHCPMSHGQVQLSDGQVYFDKKRFYVNCFEQSDIKALIGNHICWRM